MLSPQRIYNLYQLLEDPTRATVQRLLANAKPIGGELTFVAKGSVIPFPASVPPLGALIPMTTFVIGEPIITQWFSQIPGFHKSAFASSMVASCLGQVTLPDHLGKPTIHVFQDHVFPKGVLIVGRWDGAVFSFVNRFKYIVLVPDDDFLEKLKSL